MITEHMRIYLGFSIILYEFVIILINQIQSYDTLHIVNTLLTEIDHSN